MGFCLVNNAAVAAAHAVARGLARVLVVDWDVHHGNGTQEVFWARRDVFFASLHQWPLYPGTGAIGDLGVGPGRDDHQLRPGSTPTRPTRWRGCG
jgi:acetoin utilization deacetylase AcuC-like enzyme